MTGRFNVLRSPASEGTDPDGIRTRVAALKGPCPRPLDDGAGAKRFNAACLPRKVGQYAHQAASVNRGEVSGFGYRVSGIGFRAVGSRRLSRLSMLGVVRRG